LNHPSGTGPVDAMGALLFAELEGKDGAKQVRTPDIPRDHSLLLSWRPSIINSLSKLVSKKEQKTYSICSLL
jgi:hypothetical protein